MPASPMRNAWGVCISLLVMAGACLVAGCAAPGDSGEVSTIVIGGKPFNEQYILDQMIAILLEEQGFTTEIKSGMNDATLFEGMKKGQVDVYVEYTGTAYSQLLKLPPLERWEPDVVYERVSEGLEDEGITPLFKIGFRDDYAIAVREDWARETGVSTIEDLVPYAPEMVLGSDLVFHEREDGLPRLREVYGISFADVKPMSPTLMYEAIDKGQVDAIPPYTTDSRVDLYSLEILEDNKAAMPPYETMLLIRSPLAENDAITSALAPLEERIDTDTMRALNAEFDIEKREARDIAMDYLVSEGLVPAA